MIKDSSRFESTYLKEKAIIEKKLSGLLKNNNPKSLYEPCSYILNSEGKRIRALLVLLSAQAAGGRFKDVYNAAIAVEILHNFTLIHDDIMDNADKRRGLPTLHIKYDLSTAILAGDNLIAVAYQNLLKDCKSNDRRVVEAFTKGIIEICEGQSLDKEFEVRKEVSIKEYMKMIEKKTAALAKMCCSIGSQISGGSKKEIKALEIYGLNLGIAFQLQDDMLDIVGDEKEFGKKVGGDLMEGKKTYLFLRALEKARGKDKSDLIKVIRKKGIKKNQISKYRNIYIKLGVIEEVKQLVEKYTDKALKAVNKIDNAGSLKWLAFTLLKRSK